MIEETGAKKFELKPVCIYSVIGKNRVNASGEESFGMLYYADIIDFHNALNCNSEMEKILLFEELPAEWTYPQIQPLLIQEFLKRATLP